MNPSGLLLALLVVAVWGFNFIFIHVGLTELPPLFMCAIRFFFVAFPAVFFFKRPEGSWKLLAGYGLASFAGQFSFLFLAMKVGMPAGLASLVSQLQVFFSIGFAMLVFRDRPSTWKIVGAGISFLGLAIVAGHTGGEVTVAGLLCNTLAACSWAIGNMFSKKLNAPSPLGLVVWGGLVAFPVVLLVALAFEGPAAIAQALSNATWTSVGAVAYIVYLSTLVAYSAWAWLLNRYPTATVAPFTLLVPPIGFLGSFLILGEEFPPWKIGASALVLSGLVFNLLETKLRPMLRTRGA